ncbi:MAG: SAM-dependent methyltransferase, partial [Novosphingobium sp. 16-62-11]
MRRASALASIALAVLVAACDPATKDNRAETSRAFPTPDRPVSELGSNAFSNERDREERREATTVMDLARVQAGMSVADIGAGEGYYTVRLAERVTAKGRV